MAPGAPLTLPFGELGSGASPLPREGGSAKRKDTGGQTVTYIGTFGARETHDARLPASPLRTWRPRATVFTRGSLKERTPLSEQTLTAPVHPVPTKCPLCGQHQTGHRHTQRVTVTRAVPNSPHTWASHTDPARDKTLRS